MSERKALTSAEIETALHALPGWSVVEGSGETPTHELHKRFGFNDFAQAIAYITSVAGPIDAMNHHPRWENVWNRIDVYLSTHDIGGQISANDVKLAELLESHFATAKSKS
ncbi:MAG: 4a-hydroxytetrahydrobiopterin dehydratase [Acidobacteriota bacterium]|nr:4a-hydroxytetrahydrobiopterin dehydratase [Acidobacteriota bacterium]